VKGWRSVMKAVPHVGQVKEPKQKHLFTNFLSGIFTSSLHLGHLTMKITALT